MDLSIYNVIVGPVVSSKASKLLNGRRKIKLEVHPAANKPLIAKALETIFEVEVAEVHVIVRKGKVRRFKRNKIVGKTTKHAIITLKDEASFDKLTKAGAGSVMQEHVPSESAAADNA
jgi:large subunit ribosomal protein L23